MPLPFQGFLVVVLAGAGIVAAKRDSAPINSVAALYGVCLCKLIA
jgi:hypothetical protein